MLIPVVTASVVLGLTALIAWLAYRYGYQRGLQLGINLAKDECVVQLKTLAEKIPPPHPGVTIPQSRLTETANEFIKRIKDL